MNVEQPSLGRVGVESFTLSCDWHWEGGWTLTATHRLSGSQTWTQHRYEALSDDELYQALGEVAAGHLGLV